MDRDDRTWQEKRAHDFGRLEVGALARLEEDDKWKLPTRLKWKSRWRRLVGPVTFRVALWTRALRQRFGSPSKPPSDSSSTDPWSTFR